MKFARSGGAQGLFSEGTNRSDAPASSQHRAFWLKPLLTAALLAAVVCFLTPPLSAQNSFGSVLGTVTDSSGAMIPGANVSLTNEGTNTVITTKTGSAGNYVFPSLMPGQYSIKIDSKGFKTFTQTEVDVQVDGTTRVDTKLQVGTQAETVEVTGAPPDLQVNSATISSVVEEQQIQQTPLNGRNVNNLLTLVPGVVAGGDTSGSLINNQGTGTQKAAFGNYQIGGGFSGQSAFYVDGVQSMVPELNSNALVLTQDTVQEFSVETNAVSAEYGSFAGGVVSMTTKSGTNKFHGAAYEYVRNTLFNANFWFNNHNDIQRAPWHQNQFGANVGGPIVKDKTFFFFSWEHEALRQSLPQTSTFPTPAELNGDFSGAGINIYNFLAPGQPQYSYNGVLNVIPPGDIDPSAQAILKAITPTLQGPNANGLVNNWIGLSPAPAFQTQLNARVDQRFGSKNTLFGRYTYWNPVSGESDPYQKGWGRLINSDENQEAVIGDTETINSTTVADIRLSYLYEYIQEETLGDDPTANLSMSQYGSAYAALEASSKSSHVWGVVPSVAPVGYTTMGGGEYQPWINNIYALSGSLTKIVGRHTLKVGAGISSVGLRAPTQYPGDALAFASSAAFTASASGTGGNSVASFLQGTPVSTGTNAGLDSHAFYNAYGFYGTDTYQATPKLTLNLGLRWDQPSAWSEKNDLNTVILPNAPSLIPTIVNPVTSQSQTLTGALALVNSSAYSSRREEDLHWLLFQPRIGASYRVTGTTVVRLGYGISFLPEPTESYGPLFTSIVSASTTLTNSPVAGSTINTTVKNPFPTGIQQPFGRNQSLLPEYLGQSLLSCVPTNNPAAYVQQYNLTVEKTLGRSTSVSLAYAGAAGVHLPDEGAGSRSQKDLDQLPDQYDSMGSALLTPVANPFYGQIASGVLSGPTVLTGYMLKPHPQYLSMLQNEPRDAHSTYNALQVLASHHFSANGYVNLAYTWSKILTNTDGLNIFLDTSGSGGRDQDYTNLRADKSLSIDDHPSNLVLSYSYLAPFGAGQRYLNHAGSVASTIISGWRANGITTFLSGTPPSFSAGATNLSNLFQTGTIRPNVVPGCARQASAPRTPVSGTIKWINTACFTSPGQYAFGDESRTDSQVRLDGVKNFDFSLNKTTTIKENARIEFDAQFFNIFNRHQFGIPDQTMTDPTFGTVTSTLGNPRLMQFALRLDF